MDTVSSPVSHPALDARRQAMLVVLALITVTVLAVLAAAQGVDLQPGPGDPLLGPFRWIQRGLA